MKTFRILCLSTIFLFNALLIYGTIQAIQAISIVGTLLLMFLTPYVLFLPVFGLNCAIMFFRQRLFQAKRFSIYHILLLIYIIPQIALVIGDIVKYVQYAIGMPIKDLW